MRRLAGTAAAAAALVVVPAAFAGEAVLFAPPPAWVLPAPAPDSAGTAPAHTAIPLYDVQTLIDGETVTAFKDGAVTIASPEMLNQLGTIALSWQPAHGDLVVHAAQILRGGKMIDILKGGGNQFSVLRREARLEQKIVDGTLTAVMQVPGLAVGDVLRVSHSVTTTDKALGGMAQAGLALVPRPVTMHYGRARLVWPERQPIAWKALMPGVTAQPRSIGGGRRELTVMLPTARLPELPAATPARFHALAVIEASSFADWQGVARVMAPHYRTQGAITEGSELARMVDAIASAHADPVARMAEALRVVQGDVRYQLIALGSGNYVPQSPDETWRQRYGDCKAKTLLLLAMLDRMGIAAEAVLVSTRLGDMVPQRLPAAMAFDHVIVRATAGGESFWLDGTSTGGRLADIRDTPRFGWVLPVRENGAALERIVPRANARPGVNLRVDYDLGASIHLPVPFTMQLRLTGPQAEQARTIGEAGREDLMRTAEAYAQAVVGSTAILAPRAAYDAADGSWTMTVEGVASAGFGWKDGQWAWRIDPGLKPEFAPDRSKASWRELPAIFGNGGYSQAAWSIDLPQRADGYTLEGVDRFAVDLPAFSYERAVERNGTRISSREALRETGAEVPASEIGATRKAASDVRERMSRIVLPASYPQRWDDVALAAGSPELARVRRILAQRAADKPDDASRIADQGWLAMRLLDWPAAEAAYSRALALDTTLDRYVARGRLRAQRGNLAGALADARAAYDLDGNNEEARALLVAALSESGKADEALTLLEPDPSLSQQDGETKVVELAGVLSRAGRTEELFGLLDRTIAQRASSALLLNSRCWFKALAGQDLDGALADCSRAVELAPGPAAVFDSRAMVHFRAGRLAQARADLDAALALEPELAPTRFMRGIVAGKLGDRSAAARDLAAARKMHPAIDGFFAAYGIKP